MQGPQVQFGPLGPTTFRQGHVARLCRHQFDGQETVQLGRDLAAVLGEATQLQADKKRQMAELGAQIKAAEARIHSIKEKLSSGYEMRTVSCRVALDYPDKGRKTFFRESDLQAVGEAEMSGEDVQFLLNLEAEIEANAAEANAAAAAAPLVHVADALSAAVAPTPAPSVEEFVDGMAANPAPEEPGEPVPVSAVPFEESHEAAAKAATKRTRSKAATPSEPAAHSD